MSQLARPIATPEVELEGTHIDFLKLEDLQTIHDEKFENVKRVCDVVMKSNEKVQQTYFEVVEENQNYKKENQELKNEVEKLRHELQLLKKQQGV